MSVLVNSGCHNKYRKLGDLNNKNVFSPSSGGRKSEIRLPAWLGAGESSLPGLQRAAFWLCVHLAFPDCVYIRKKRVLSLALLIRTQILSDEDLTLMVSFNLITFKKLCFQIRSHWRLGLRHECFRGHNSVHSRDGSLYEHD